MNYKPKAKPKPTTYPRFAGKYGAVEFKNVKPWGDPTQTQPYRRDTPKPPSKNPADQPNTYAAKPNPMRYTGTACLGIAAMHKSNLVPVFTQDQAVDTATMRRN